MSEVNPTGGAYAGDVRTQARNAGAGMVTVGGVTLSPADAAEFVMMHRTEVMKKVGADRTEMAQQHLDRIKTARQYLTDMVDMKKFNDTGKSYKDRIPVTPEMIDFLKNDVGCTPGEWETRIVVNGSAVPKLPESVRDHYGMYLDRFGNYQPDASGGMYGAKSEGHGKTELYPVTVIDGDNLDSLKEEVNNYIDQQNDSNNLFMTKFKSVVNSMNEALEGANSMADKSHDTLKNLVSRW